MENVDKDYEVLETGIGQLLGKVPYPPAERASDPCVHVSDGFVYGDNTYIILLQCAKCGLQYEVLIATGKEL
jgi:hypothetical protein